MVWFLSTAAAAEAVPPAAKAVVETVSAGAAAGLPAANDLVVAGTNWEGIAIVIGAVVLGLIQLFNTWATWQAKKDAASAKISSDEAKAQSATTAQAVDGKMSEVVRLVEQKVTAEATLAEKDAQKMRDADKVLGAAPHVIAPGNGGAVNTSATVQELLTKAIALMAADRKP